MCTVNLLEEKLEALEDYFQYVNTDLESKMTWEPDLYAAYAAHNHLTISTITEWYEEAEDSFISTEIETYLQNKYEVWAREDVDYYYEKEAYRDGTIFECGGYFFYTQ